MKSCSLVHLPLNKNLRPLRDQIVSQKQIKKALISWGWGHKMAGPGYYTNSIGSHLLLGKGHKTLPHKTHHRYKAEVHGGEGIGVLRRSQPHGPDAQMDIRG